TPPRWPSSSVRSPTTSPRSRRNRPADPSSPADPPNRRAPQVRDASAGPAAGAAAVPVSRLGPAAIALARALRVVRRTPAAARLSRTAAPTAVAGAVPGAPEAIRRHVRPGRGEALSHAELVPRPG